MEWYQWVMMFGGTALVGLIIADIYIFFKSRSKKAIEKHRHAKEQDERALIADVVKEVMAPSCSNLESIKTEVINVKTDLEELKPIKADVLAVKTEILAVKKEVTTIKKEDIKLLAAANRDSLRNQLLTVFRECQAKGYKTTEDIRNFEYMFDSYKALGGNSFMIDIAKQMEHIPPKVEGITIITDKE